MMGGAGVIVSVRRKHRLKAPSLLTTEAERDVMMCWGGGVKGWRDKRGVGEGAGGGGGEQTGEGEG